VDAKTLDLFDRSLLRCESRWDFFDRFYDRFLAASPEVREKFAQTDFTRQKRALRASFHHLLLAAQNEERGPDAYLGDIAARHGAGQMAIGSDMYDLWLDSLLATVKECDPDWSPAIEKAWEDVMMVGIRYLCGSYHRRTGS
jgi:hemoglobin-like flavoprotein